MPATRRNVRNGNHQEREAVLLQTISRVTYAGHEMTPWYPSYYHEEVSGKGRIDQLYVCTHCFKYSSDISAYAKHMLYTCEYKDSWPGWRCYSKGDYEIFEVDGEEHLLFAQNLSLFGKLFIENKSVCFDVGGFLYYVLVEMGEIVGFFSKEKLSWDNNNLACILVFPPYQARGNGQKLMAASYEMSRREGRPGGPERPLSEPGRKSYEAFWIRAIARVILGSKSGDITVRELCDTTYITHEDISATLAKLAALERRGDGSFAVNKRAVRSWLASHRIDVRPTLDPSGYLDAPSPASSDSEDETASEVEQAVAIEDSAVED